MKGSPQWRATLAICFVLLTALSALQLPGQTVLSGTYTNATIFDDVILNPSTSATFTGTSTFTGTTGTWGTSSGLNWQQIGTLTGKVLNLASGSYIYVTGTNSTLTLGPGTSVTGSGSMYSDGSPGTAIINQGSITLNSGGSGSYYANSFTNDGSILANAGNHYIGYPSATYVTTNSATGTITANGSGTTIFLRGPVDNNGVVTAQAGGQLMWQGTTTTANLGTVQAAGGRALFNGTIDNTAATLNAPASGIWELYGGTIQGGTIAAGALNFTTSGGYLDGAALTGDLTLPASTWVRFTGGANFTGVNANLGGSANLQWQQTGTLSGDTLNFANGSYIYLLGAGSSLTLAPTTTVTGTVTMYSDGSAGSSITNQGIITNTANTGSIYSISLTNDGSITASNGSTLYIGYPSASYATTNSATGTITANGADVYLRGPVDNNGTIVATNSGQLIWQGTTTTANLGTVQAAGGRALFGGTINNTAATLNAPATGIWELYGGTIQGGTIAAGALTFTTSGGYLDGATLTGDLTLPASTWVRFTGGANFTGVNANLGGSASLQWQQAGTLSGDTLNFANGAYMYVLGTGSGLTLAPTTTATGTVQIYSDGSAGTSITNQGIITHTANSGSLYSISLTNDGSITASNGSTLYIGYPSASYVTTNSATGTITSNGASTSVYLRGPVDNNGTIVATGSGQLIWQGTTTTANLGTVQAGGGRALLNGTIDNTAATLNAPATGIWELYGGTIQGGTISAGALAYTNNGGYLDGATLTGDLTLPASTWVRFTGGSNFTGVNANLGGSSSFQWQQVGTLTGDTLNFANGAYMYVLGAGSSLTLAPTTTATGTVQIYSDGSAGSSITNQGIITQTANTGSLYSISLTNSGSITANAGTLYIGYPSPSYATTNTATGTITSNGSGTSVYLRGPVDNNGTITATNSGQLIWQGTTTTANLGTVQAAGGRALFSGTIDNTAATLNAPASGVYELYGGTIQGGTIAAGALAFTNNGGYLDGATLTGDLTLPASTWVRFTGGANFTGVNANLGGSASFQWQQAGTLTGDTLNFANGAYVYVIGAGSGLTLAPTTTATGTVQMYTDGSAGSSITNQGIITHTANTGSLYAISLTNNGSITASSGTFYIGYPSTSYVTTNGVTGSITSTGASTSVYLRGPFTNNGLIQAQAGTIYTGGSLVNGLTGILAGAGTLNGSLTMAGGTLAPGNSIGALTQTAGSFTVTGPTNFNVELSGATADQLLFVNPLTIDIGNGLMSLNLTLLGAPAPGSVYDLMKITSGTGTITGKFLGLPNSGDYLTANYLGTDYSFFVTYLTNKITLSVPEPGTYALTGFGLAVLALMRRRRGNSRPAR